MGAVPTWMLGILGSKERMHPKSRNRRRDVFTEAASAKITIQSML
jgi:hypothetical protein